MSYHRIDHIFMIKLALHCFHTLQENNMHYSVFLYSSVPRNINVDSSVLKPMNVAVTNERRTRTFIG
jgi:hypothetical protein